MPHLNSNALHEDAEGLAFLKAVLEPSYPPTKAQPAPDPSRGRSRRGAKARWPAAAASPCIARPDAPITP
jgi:hypothetical protein